MNKGVSEKDLGTDDVHSATFDHNLSKIRLFGRGGKLTGCLKHMLTATHIGSLESPLDIKDEKGKPLKNINGSEKISKLLKILIIF